MDAQYHGIRRRGVDYKRKGAGIDAFCKVKAVDKNVTLTLLIVNCYMLFHGVQQVLQTNAVKSLSNLEVHVQKPVNAVLPSDV